MAMLNNQRVSILRLSFCWQRKLFVCAAQDMFEAVNLIDPTKEEV